MVLNSTLPNGPKFSYPLTKVVSAYTLLKDKNHDLLAKWVWQFQTERDALWRILVAAKYDSLPHHGLVFISTAKGPWKFIIKQQRLVTNRIKFGVGDGALILHFGLTNGWLMVFLLYTTLSFFSLSHHGFAP